MQHGSGIKYSLKYSYQFDCMEYSLSRHNAYNTANAQDNHLKRFLLNVWASAQAFGSCRIRQSAHMRYFMPILVLQSS